MVDPLEYWELRAPSWLLESHSDPLWDKVLQEKINPQWNLLELGCGDGRWSVLSEHYTGSDIAPSFLEEAQKRYPDKRFAHHDMRSGVTGEWDLIFTFTAWLHMPPRDILQVQLPDTRLLFVEPHRPGNGLHCWTHDYRKLFGCEILERKEALTMWGRGL